MRLFIILFILSIHTISIAQSPDPVETITNLFLAMETNDSSLARKLFTEDAMLFTIYNDSSKVPVKVPADRLIEAFGKPKEDHWQEPFWNEVVKIDDRFASIWVDYAFYLNGKLSHCGVDAFHMVYIESRWKIFHLTDTRRTDCVIPEDIVAKFEK